MESYFVSDWLIFSTCPVPDLACGVSPGLRRAVVCSPMLLLHDTTHGKKVL